MGIVEVLIVLFIGSAMLGVAAFLVAAAVMILRKKDRAAEQPVGRRERSVCLSPLPAGRMLIVTGVRSSIG